MNSLLFPSAKRHPRIARRDFLAGTLLGGLSLAYGGAATAASHRGGTATVGLNGANTSDGLNPAQPQDVFMASMTSAVWDRLFEIDEAGRPAPILASDWDIASSADRLSIGIKQDVEFHDGRALTVEDVLQSLNFHRIEGSSSPLKVLFDQIDELRADGPDRISITLKGKNADFIYYLASFEAVIGQAGEEMPDWGAGIGTGPYRIVSFDPGVRAELARHEAHHSDGRGFLDQITLIGINDDNARVAAVQSGSVDLISYVPPRLVSLLEQEQNVTVREVPSTLHYTMPMITTAAPFDDNNIRLALKLATDRKAILDKILLGYGHLGNDQPIAPSLAYFADIEQREYDPDQARQLVRKSGIGQLKIDLHASDAAFSGAVDTAVIMADSARRAGIEINVVREPPDGYWSRVWRNRPFCFSWSGGRPTNDWMFSQHYTADAVYNETFWSNERFNSLLLQARAETRDEQRAELYAEMQRICRDEGGAIIPVFANHVMAHTRRVRLPERKLGGIWTLDNYRGLTTIKSV